MITHGNEIKLFAGSSNRPLAEAIAAKLNTTLGNVEVGKFSDGETSIHIAETVRGRDLFIIQSTSDPVNDNLMELLIMIDAAKRASAGRVTAVMPVKTEKRARAIPLRQNLLPICLLRQVRTECLQWICTPLKFKDFSIFP